MAGARFMPCPTCHGTGSLVISVDDGEDELEREFRRLEVAHGAQPYQRAVDCQNCGTPYLHHRDVVPSVGYFCTIECFKEFLKADRVPLVLRRQGGEVNACPR